MKKIRFILILAISVFILFVLKDVLIKASIESAVSYKTGLRIEIGELKTSFSKGFIRIKDMFILNPKGYDDRIMAELPEVSIDYDLPAILKRKIHLQNIKINLKELTIVKEKSGRKNLDHIKNLKKKKTEKQKEKDSGSLGMQIDNLYLKMGKVTYKDYSSGGKPTITEFDININARYKNLKNTDAIMRLIIAKAVISTTLGALTDFEKFEDIASDALGEGKNVFKKTFEEIKSLFGTPEDEE